MFSPARRRPFGCLLLVLLLSGPSACMPAPGSDVDPAVEAAVDDLDRLLDEVWERRLERDLSARLFLGLPLETIPDLTLEAAESDAEFARDTLVRLGNIDPGVLPGDRWLDYRVLERDASMTVEGFQYYWFNNVLTPYSSPLGTLPRLLAAMPVADADDLERYLAVVGEIPALVTQIEQHVRSQAELEIVVPTHNLPAVVGLVRATRQPAAEGPFALDEARVGGLDADTLEQFRADLARIVESEVNPALDRLEDYLIAEYSQLAPAAVGVDVYPGGDAYYRYLVRLHTTMDVTPEDVQAVGYEMVGEMQERMREIQAEIGFDGTPEEFRAHLLADPANYPSTPDEVADALMTSAEAFYARVDEFFPTRPQAPFGVRRLAPSLEGSQTYGFYNPGNEVDPTGYYYFNGSSLDQRSRLPLKGLAYHELFPGHHFQISLQRENERLHDHRKATLHGAYTEGWGSYSSYLGLESGLLADPLEEYGLYMLEIFLATRLVVDPGMNAFDMTLEEARAFMAATTFESPTQIATESLRYSTDMPGQALAYQMGKRKLIELRERAETELGERFDIRDFHAAVLSAGSLPMSVLEEHIDRWIAARRSDA